MHFEPLELTEQDKQWIEEQQAAQQAILNAFTLISPQKHEPTKPEPTQEQKAFVRGMAICGEVARLYKQRGNPPKWMKRVEVEPGKFAWVKDDGWENKSQNRVYRRSIRFSLNRRQPDQYACGKCNLPYVGPTTQRCQCKPVVLAKSREEAA